MTDQQIQDILNADYRKVRQIFTDDTYCPSDYYHYLTLEDFTALNLAYIPVDFRFLRRPKFCRDYSKISYDDLELAIGRLKNCILSGFYITRSDLVMEFIKTGSRDIAKDALAATATIAKCANDSKQAAHLRAHYEKKIYENHTHEIHVVGDFQAVFTDRRKEKAIIVTNGRKSCYATIIEDDRITEAIYLRHDKSLPNIHVTYS